ncbi:MAG: I78 family peptidase inhibitor [Sphingorhabdus sp.]
MKYLLLLGLPVLAACTNSERTAPYSIKNVPADQAGGFECDATAVQYAVGQKASIALAQALMTKSGALTLRWVPPRSAVTMDFSPIRLNIGYDDAMTVNLVTCG